MDRQGSVARLRHIMDWLTRRGQSVAQAARTGGPGWQTPTTWARGPMAASMSRTWSM